MSSPALIACTRCAISKARCDRKVPCSQCVARGYVCQPRCTSRRPRAPRKSSARNQAPADQTTSISPDSDHVPSMDQFTGYMVPESQPPQNNDMFAFANPALPQGPLDLSGYDDFMGFSYPGTSANADAMDTSNNLFASISSMEIHGSDPPYPSGCVGSEHMFQQQHHHNLSRVPNQPPTPPDTTPRGTTSIPASSPALPNTHTPPKEYPPATPRDISATPDDVLAQMVDLLAQPDAWHGLPDSGSGTSQTLSHDARDRIVATVQLLLQRALRSRRSPSPSSQGLFGRIVVLPPSHVLMQFIDTYAARVDSIQPYLGLSGSPVINIPDILQVDMADVGILLIILLITQGAMLTDHLESHILANGLIEVCRVALDDVLESRSISQPMIGGIALQLLTLCARSGKDSFAAYARSKRGQYLSMLKCTGVLQPEQTLHSVKSERAELWERWKEQEQQNRHAYAWVYVDLEVSLLHDLPPILSINDLQVPLPQENELWHAQTYSEWLEHSGANGTRPGPCNPAKFGAWLEQHGPGAPPPRSGHTTPSLNGLFRSFLQGRLAVGDDTPLHHLRLLLHPLLAMVLEQQQLLRIFDTDEPSNRYRVLSKIKILGRLQETQDLLQDLGTLLTRSKASAVDDDKGQAHPTDCVSMIMLHLVSLNVFTSMPEMEKCAKEEPPASESARAEMWRWARYPEGESYVLFHAGQIFRLIDRLAVDARPTWWPVALYRAAMSCWSLRSLDRPSLSGAVEVYIDALLPEEEERFLNTTTGTPVVMLDDKRRLPILEGNNSLQYCIGKLESRPTHCSRNVLEKARYFLTRWS